MGWVLFFVLTTQVGVTSSVTYFKDEVACNASLTAIGAELPALKPAGGTFFLHCLPLESQSVEEPKHHG